MAAGGVPVKGVMANRYQEWIWTTLNVLEQDDVGSDDRQEH